MDSLAPPASKPSALGSRRFPVGMPALICIAALLTASGAAAEVLFDAPFLSFEVGAPAQVVAVE